MFRLLGERGLQLSKALTVTLQFHDSSTIDTARRQHNLRGHCDVGGKPYDAVYTLIQFLVRVVEALIQFLVCVVEAFFQFLVRVVKALITLCCSSS